MTVPMLWGASPGRGERRGSRARGAYDGQMLAAVRATHEHLDLGVLDALSRGADRLGEVIGQLNEPPASAVAQDAEALDPPLAGWAVVSTCNRLEVYLDARRFHDGLELVVRALSTTSGLDADHVSLCLEAATGVPVAQHLYEVTAGLRSIVLGEAEISGQVRTAFERSRRAGHTTAMLNDLFQIGFRCAKQVAATTPVGAAGRSSAAIALDRAAELLGDLRERSVLVIGTGAYARLGVAELTRRGCEDVRVHSGSGRAVAFAERQGVQAIGAEDLPAAMARADLVLACSGRGTSLFPELFLHAGRTLVLDLALHSDLHPLVRHVGDVRVLDLTDLTTGDDPSRPALEAAKAVVAESVATFESRQEFRRVDPAMTALRRAVDEAAAAEVARMRRSRDDEVADDVERSIRRILAKVMHSPTVRARSLAAEGNADEFVEAVHTVFGVDITAGRTLADQQDPEATGASALAAGWMRVDQTVPPRDLDRMVPAVAQIRLRAAAPPAPTAQEPRACPIDHP